MEQAKAKRLSALLWRDRLRANLLSLVIAGVLATGAILYVIDSQRTAIGHAKGQVDGWTRHQGKFGSMDQVLTVSLADGTKVNVVASEFGRVPRIGETIELTEVRTGLGRIYYNWDNTR